MIEIEGKGYGTTKEISQMTGASQEVVRKWCREGRIICHRIGMDYFIPIPTDEEMSRIRAIFEDWENTGADDKITEIRRWNSDDPMDFEWEIANSKLTEEQKEARERLLKKWQKELEKLGIKGKVSGWLVYTRLWYQGRM